MNLIKSLRYANYRVIQINNYHIYACGTHRFLHHFVNVLTNKIERDVILIDHYLVEYQRT